ncbi:MAG: peroxiredoxin family protein [Planctomycetota bacterium]
MDRATKRFAAAAILTLAASVPAQQQDEGIAIKGTVVDRQGQPVAEARIGTGWWYDHSQLSAYGSQYVWPADTTREANGWSFTKTAPDGSFDARIKPRKGKVQLIVFSADGEDATTFLGTVDDDLTQLKLRLEPVARMRATITCSEIGEREVPATCYLRSVDGRRLGRFHAKMGVVDVRLPAGHYSLYLYGAFGQEIGRREFAFMVTAGEDAKARDIDIPANNLTRMRGRTMPPWHATEARGIALTDASIEHFRGKWLLVDVWHYRSSSPSRLYPDLIEFDQSWREQHPDQEPPYAVVLLHSGKAESLADLDQKIDAAGLREKHWDGRQLPFPILIDPEAKTAKSWKLRWTTNTLLIDPEGKLWGETDRLQELTQIVAGTLEPATPIRLRPKPKIGK